MYIVYADIFSWELDDFGAGGNNSTGKWINSSEMTMDNGRLVCSVSELVEQYYSLLYRYSFRLTGSAADAEDIVQQTFLIAQTKIDQLREPQHAKAWLFTIARNAYLKDYREKRGTNHVSLENIPELSGECPAEAKLDREQLLAILDELEDEYRTPLILFYFDEFSYKEIAAQMEMPIGTVMSRLSRAKAYLRRRLAPFEPAATRQ